MNTLNIAPALRKAQRCLSLPRVLALFIVFLSATSCQDVPITERNQLILLPSGYVQDMSFSSYDKFLTKNEHKLLDSSHERTKKLKEVGEDIVSATEEFLANKNESYRLDGFEWEFNVVADSQVNAWCMSGGKIVFYTGIMDVAQEKSELAVIMGHEVAHAVAKHGNERMTQKMAVQAVGMILSLFMSEQPAFIENLLLQAYGMGSKMGILAYSRAHESEADKLGLILMAKAGYNPAEAVDFWQSMAQQSDKNVPVFFSTHPSDKQRVQDLKDFMPRAKQYKK